MIRRVGFSSNTEFRDFLLERIGVDPRGLPYFYDKSRILFYHIPLLENRFANMLKQEMLSAGGDAAVHRDVAYLKKGRSSVLLMATPKQFRLFIRKAASQIAPLRSIGQRIAEDLDGENRELLFEARGKKLRCGSRLFVMGVLNATLDSFYDGGRYNFRDRGFSRIDSMVENGADILDLGGESSRPGARKLGAKEELERIMPFIRYVKKRHRILLSVDTCKSEVAAEALKNGADIINDITALRSDRKTASLIARHKAGVVLMHMKGTPRTMQKNPRYARCGGLMAEIASFLAGSMKIALENGIKMSNIILDPGIGFGKTPEHNFRILSRLEELKSLGRPLLVGLSRKSLIGSVLGNPPEERLTGTLALNTAAFLNGAAIIRVHDVKEHTEVARLMEVLLQKEGARKCSG